MNINYDPDKTAELSGELVALANEMRFHCVHVICDLPDAKVGDHVGITFWAITPFLPHVGDVISLVSGDECEVRKVIFSVSHTKAGALFAPTIHAFLLSKEPLPK